MFLVCVVSVSQDKLSKETKKRFAQKLISFYALQDFLHYRLAGFFPTNYRVINIYFVLFSVVKIIDIVLYIGFWIG